MRSRRQGDRASGCCSPEEFSRDKRTRGRRRGEAEMVAHAAAAAVTWSGGNGSGGLSFATASMAAPFSVAQSEGEARDWQRE